jgi:hypothetical protein
MPHYGFINLNTRTIWTAGDPLFESYSFLLCGLHSREGRSNIERFWMKKNHFKPVLAFDTMFALLKKAQIEELYLTGGLSYKSLKEHEIARNGDMIDFCTTTYSSISNRVSTVKL